MGRATTILAYFAVGAGLFVLIKQGIIPASLGQVFMFIWVLVMRNVAMPVALESAQAADDKDAAAAAAAATAGGKSGSTPGGGSGKGSSAARQQRGKDE